MQKKLLLCITGASGSIYALRFLEKALKLNLNVECVVSEKGKKVVPYELDIPYGSFKKKFSEKGVRFFEPSDLFAPPSSGSYLKREIGAVVVLPCSVSTLGAVANGSGHNLIHRACDVALKERVPLILAVREMPLNAIHLENMLKLQRLGALAFPISPAFYHRPKDIKDLVDFVVGKIFDLLGVEHDLYNRWGSEK